MSAEKPIPMIQEIGKRECPVCGKATYSRGGIHPQCAITQADAPRQKKLSDAKKKKVQAKPKGERNSWTKQCPKCHVDLHVRKMVCVCGHRFK